MNVNVIALRSDPVSHMFCKSDAFKMDPSFRINNWYDFFLKTAKFFHRKYLVHSHCPFFLMLPPPHKSKLKKFFGS